MDLNCQETLQGTNFMHMHIAVTDYEYHQPDKMDTKCLTSTKQIPAKLFLFSQQLSPKFLPQKLKTFS